MTKCLKYTGLTRIEWNKLQNLACQSRFQEYIQVSSKMVVTIEYQTDNLEYDPEIESLENANSPLKEKKTCSEYRMDVSTPFLKGDFL